MADTKAEETMDDRILNLLFLSDVAGDLSLLHKDLLELFNTEIAKAGTNLLDELEARHEEVCGATRTGDKVNRCEYPNIIEAARKRIGEEKR